MILELPLPQAALDRLQKRERFHRNETRKMDYKGRKLKVEPVNILGLWLLQQGQCACGQCEKPLDPHAVHPDDESIVIAHRLLRDKGGSHCVKNVELWRKACNDREAALEKRAGGVGNRTGFSLTRKAKPKEERRKSKWQSGGFQTNKDGPYKQSFNKGVVRR